MQKPFLKLVLAISIDGRLAPSLGGPAHLGGDGDRRVLEEALAWSDGALIGGKTLRTHGCTCLVRQPHLIEGRISEGRSEQPIAIVVSKGLGHQSDWPFFSQPVQRWLLTPESVISQSHDESLSGYERKLYLAHSWLETLESLAEIGLERLLLLGGANLISSCLQEDLIDELQLTFTPRLLGGQNCWIPPDFQDIPLRLQASDAWNLHSHELIGSNELMVRYLRNRNYIVNK